MAFLKLRDQVGEGRQARGWEGRREEGGGRRCGPLGARSAGRCEGGGGASGVAAARLSAQPGRGSPRAASVHRRRRGGSALAPGARVRVRASFPGEAGA